MIDVFDLDVDDVGQMMEHALGTALRGGPKSDCPVSPSHPLWNDWQRAWTDQRRVTERESGAMGYRTRLMKDEVRRQMEGLPEYGPDPAAEVTERSGSFTWRRGDSVVVNFTADASKVKEAFERVAIQCEKVTTFCATWDATGAVWSAFGELATDPPEPTVAQKRHGSAAVCPRHGQTKGGTCMKCARGRR